MKEPAPNTYAWRLWDKERRAWERLTKTVAPPPKDHILAKQKKKVAEVKVEVAVKEDRAHEVFSALNRMSPKRYSEYNAPHQDERHERVCEMCGKVYLHHHLQAVNLCGTVHIKGSCSYKAKLLRKIMRYRARQGIEGMPSDYTYKPKRGGWKWGKKRLQT